MPDPITLFVGLQGLIGTAGALFVANNFALIALSIGSVALGNYQRRKVLRRARDAYNASLQDRLVMTATTDGPRSRVYGRVRTVDGVLFKATRGANSEFYTLVIAVAGHEVDAIESIYFNDELLTLDGNGWVQTAPWMQTKRVNAWADITVSGGVGSVSLPYTPVSGSVQVTMSFTGGDTTSIVSATVVGTLVSIAPGIDGTARVGYQYDIADKSYARVRSYLGTAAQDLSTDLVADFPTLCQSTDKFRGIALLRVDLEYSQDAFPTGVPNVTAVARGAKVYDTRDGVTRWTQNPALIARDWARYAYGGNTTSVSDTAITTAANVCDADASFALPSGTVVMDTYQAGIVCKLDLSPQDALSEMVEAMAGRWGWAGGTLKLVAGAYRAPVDTITEDWISDATDIVVTPAPSRSELVNIYRPTISNRDNKYQIEPAPPLIASTYVSDDGQELPAEIGMSAVTSIAHAQHISGVLLRDARQSLVVQLPCNLRAWKLELFDTVNVTLSRFGWSAKLFEVMGWRFSLQGGVLLTLKEANATVYNVDAGFADLGYDDNTELPDPWTVEVVQGLTVTSGTAALTDGSIITRTKVSWTAATDANVLQGGRIEIQWIEGFGFSDEEWPGTLEAGNSTSTTITGLRANMVYLFRARYINGAGVRSRWCLHVAHKIAPILSAGLNIVTDANCTYFGDTISKVAGGDAWNAGAYSRDAYVGGAVASIVVPDVAGLNNVVFGLNRTNTTGSYTDIDFGINLQGGSVYVSEEGSIIGPYSTYAAGETYAVEYDGQTVRYVRNGVPFYARGATVYEPLMFDCSLYAQGGKITGLRFAPMSTPTNRNLVDSRTWVVGSTGSQPGFTQETPTNGGGSNTISLSAGPDGRTTTIWIGQDGAGPGTNANGGFRALDRPIDHTKIYRFSVWLFVATGVDGAFYLGPGESTVNNIGGGVNSNPYFLNNIGRNAITPSAWHLLIGYVFPSSYAGAQQNQGGVWRASDGKKVAGITGTDFRWVSGQGFTHFRTYTYSSTAASRTDWCGPRLEVCDGAEPTIQQLLSMGAQALADSKVNTFIQASVPTSTAIGDLWFDSDDGYKLYRADSAGADQITAGEWVAYQYGTSALASESATQVFLDEAQSNVYVSESSGGALDNRQLFNRQWTNTTGRTVTVEITGSAKVGWSRNASANGSYSCSGDTQLLVYKNAVLQLGIAQIAAPTPLLTSGAPTSTQYANGAYTLTLSPGDALEVRLYTACNHGNGGGANDDCTISSTGTLRVTVVKA